MLGLPPDCELGTHQEMLADRVVITEGRPTRRFVLVVSGELCVCSGGRRLAGIGPGDWCGEIGLIGRLKTNNGRATATVCTKTAAKVISFAPWEFKEMIDTYPEVEQRLLASAQRRIERSREAQ